MIISDIGGWFCSFVDVVLFVLFCCDFFSFVEGSHISPSWSKLHNIS
jgi:hypothetical protein